MAESTGRTPFFVSPSPCCLCLDQIRVDWVQAVSLYFQSMLQSCGFDPATGACNILQQLTVIPSQQQQVPSALCVWWSRVGPGSCDLQVVPASRYSYSAGNWLRGWPFGIQPAVSWHGCSDSVAIACLSAPQDWLCNLYHSINILYLYFIICLVL